MVAARGRSRLFEPSRFCLVLASFAIATGSFAQTAQDRTQLIAQIAGQNLENAAGLLGVLSWGTRPWETAISAPVIVEQRDPANNLDRTFYFALEAGDLGRNAPRLPRSKLEESFERVLRRLISAEGAADWPIYVFSASGASTYSPDVFSLATTRRIFVREGKGALQPAAAILLNSDYWGTNEAGLDGEDRLTQVVAAHELYHAKRAWLRAGQTAAHADAIEARLQEAGVSVANRAGLESLVQQGMLAWEEVQAVDQSLVGSALPTYRKQSLLEYRERNKELQKKVIKLFAGLFTSVKESVARKNLESWLTDLLRKDL